MRKLVLIIPRRDWNCYWEVEKGDIYFDKKYDWFWEMLGEIDENRFVMFWMELALSNPDYIKIIDKSSHKWWKNVICKQCLLKSHKEGRK